MKRIGLFGGTFNPVHNGHILCCESLIKRKILDEVIFIPSFIPPLKDTPEGISPEMRLDMLQRALFPYSFFSLSDLELKRSGTSYTIDTVGFFKNNIAQDEKLHLIIGNDWIDQFHKWKDYEKLSDMVDFIIMLREGNHAHITNPHLTDTVKEKLQKGITDVPTIPVSSSEIRERIKDKEYLKENLPESVYNYILENKLYL